jgi:hypothetical protein
MGREGWLVSSEVEIAQLPILCDSLEQLSFKTEGIVCQQPHSHTHTHAHRGSCKLLFWVWQHIVIIIAQNDKLLTSSVGKLLITSVCKRCSGQRICHDCVVCQFRLPCSKLNVLWMQLCSAYVTSKSSRPALGSTQHHIQRVPGGEAAGAWSWPLSSI